METEYQHCNSNKIVQTTLEFFDSLIKQNLPPKHEIYSKSTIFASFCIEDTKSFIITSYVSFL